MALAGPANSPGPSGTLQGKLHLFGRRCRVLDSDAHPSMNAAFKRDNAKSVGRAAKLRKQEILPSEAYTSSDSSADEEPIEASAAPEPDADITYSFDADKGPSQGSQILNQALVQAIERYEDRKTHELVEDEYEVLDENGEAAQRKARRSAKGKKKATKSDDDDFVVV